MPRPDDMSDEEHARLRCLLIETLFTDPAARDAMKALALTDGEQREAVERLDAEGNHVAANVLAAAIVREPPSQTVSEAFGDLVAARAAEAQKANQDRARGLLGVGITDAERQHMKDNEAAARTGLDRMADPATRREATGELARWLMLRDAAHVDVTEKLIRRMVRSALEQDIARMAEAKARRDR